MPENPNNRNIDLHKHSWTAIVIENYQSLHTLKQKMCEKVAFEESKFMKPAIHNRNIAVAYDFVITV